MSLFVKSVLLIIVCVCSVVLGGCTSSRLTLFDGDPYTADDIKSMVEEHFEAYHPRLVLQSSKVITTKPYKRNEYTFFACFCGGTSVAYSWWTTGYNS